MMDNGHTAGATRYPAMVALIATGMAVATTGCGSDCVEWASETGGMCFPNNPQAALLCEDQDACEETGYRIGHAILWTAEAALFQVTEDMVTTQPIGGTYACSTHGSATVTGNFVVLTPLSFAIDATVALSDCRDDPWLETQVSVSASALHYVKLFDMNAGFTNDIALTGVAAVVAHVAGVDRLGRTFARELEQDPCDVQLAYSQKQATTPGALTGMVCDNATVSAVDIDTP